MHPWAPRFAQAITGMLCLEAIIFQTQAVVVIAAVFIALALIGPRWSPVAYLLALLPLRPAELEPSRPVRFAQLMAISMLIVAIALLYAGAGLEGASSHSGRRTFLTNLANKGTAIHILKTLAGHRSISTTAAYLYSSPSQLKAAVELV